MGLKETRFATVENIRSNVTAELRKILKRNLPPLLSTVEGSMCKDLTLKVIT
jgi:hypothetical protein